MIGDWRETRARVLRWSVRLSDAVSPLALQAAVLAYALAAHRWIRFSETFGDWMVLAALPPLLAEIGFTAAYELSARRVTWWELAGLGARLSWVGIVSFMLIIMVHTTRGTIEPVAPLLGNLHHFLWLAWSSSPLPSALACLVIGAAYVRWTVRRRQARFVTTVLLPGVATVSLSALLYEMPEAALRGRPAHRPELVQRVWHSELRDHRYPHDLVVTPDERYAVATFGSTLTFLLPDEGRPANDLGLPGDGTELEFRRNTVLIELESGDTYHYGMLHTRRIFGTGTDRVFVTPWGNATMIELGMDGSTLLHDLPSEVGGAVVDEVNFTGYYSDVGRVYIANNKNPVVFAWDAVAGRLEHTVALAGWNGIRMGDNVVALARNHVLRRIYVLLVASQRSLVELDERTMEPRRVATFPSDGADIVVSQDGETIFVSSFYAPEIWRIDARSLSLVDQINGPPLARRIALSADGEFLIASSYITGELWVFDVRTGRGCPAVFVAPKLEGLSVTEHAAFLLGVDGIYRVPIAELRARWRSCAGRAAPAPR